MQLIFATYLCIIKIMRKTLALVVFLLLSVFFVNAQNNIIDDELQNILNQKGNDYIDVNIMLKAQMTSDDFSVLNCKSDSKEVRRELVTNELKKFAEKSQRDIMSVINAEERSNSVIDIKTYWIANFINCKAKRDVIYQLASHPDVALITYNSEMDTEFMLSNEETRGTQAATGTIAQHVTQIKADKVWDLGYTGKGVVVAVLDSGSNLNHADIKDHLWNGNGKYGYNVHSTNSTPLDEGSNGHGTHCAGIVCGDGTSGQKTGIAPDATLMTIKIIGGGRCTAQNLVEGVQKAAELGADIISLSVGRENPDENRALFRQTFTNLLQSNIAAAVACGNDGNTAISVPHNVRTPGDCPPPWIHPDQQGNANNNLTSVISVGAVNENNVVSPSSSKGPVTWQNIAGYNDYPYNPGIGLIRPDIAAPGENVYSLNVNNNNGYWGKSGTSQAAPCVAGVMALMLEKNPDLTPADLCRIIETTASNKPANKNNSMGSGVIDALAAVQAVNFDEAIVLNPYDFTRTLNTGSNLNLELTLINNGSGSTNGNTTVTISENDIYTSIITGSKSYSTMASGKTASATFVVSVDALAPDNHEVTFTVNAGTRTFDIVVTISNEFVAPSLTATANGTDINLTWNATNNATSYNIYRNGAFLANTTSTSYTDTGLEYGTLYAYTVTSKRGDLESEHSLITRAQTEDNPDRPSPTNVKVNNGIITWTNGTGSKDSKIYRKDVNTSVETNIATNVNETSYTDNNWNSLADGVYQYGVANTYAANEIVYTQNFTDLYLTNSTGIYPTMNAYWYIYREGSNNSYNWKIDSYITNGNTYESFSGKAAFITSNFTSSSYLSYLVTRPMTYNEDVKLSFKYITPAWGNDINTLKVMVSRDTHTGTWEELWSSNKTDVQEWTEAVVDLSAYAGQQIYIAFVNVAGYGYCTGVDEVSIAVEGSSESRIEWSENIYKNYNIFVNDGLWSNTDNWAARRLPNANDSQVIIDANATIASGNITVNSLTINEGKTLTLNDGAALTVNGDFTNTDVDAFIINDGAQVFQNNDDVSATFVMNISNPDEWTNKNKDGWQFIASPVKDANIEDFVPSSSRYDLYKYDGNKGREWLNHKDKNDDDDEEEEPEMPEVPEVITTSTITIGNSDIVQMSAPIYNAASGSYSLSQQIYTNEEIGIERGFIKSISFHHSTGNNNARNIEVYMKNTDKESFSDNYDWITFSDDDMVYQGVYTFGEAEEWVTIEFPDAFEYTGKNLVLIVYDKTGTNYNYNYEICDKFYSSQINTLRGKYIYKTSEINISQLSTYYGNNMKTASWGTPANVYYINHIKLTVASSATKNRFNDNTDELSNFETTFQQGVGYLASYESETTATFKGTLNHEKSFTFNVSYNSDKDLANFHLLGNPFSFDMNWDKVATSNMINGYAVVNNEGGYNYATSGEIKVGDGFFVKATGATPSISYNTRSKNDKKETSLNVIATSKGGKDNVIVRLDEEQEGFPKIKNLNEDIALVYVLDNKVPYGIYNYSEDVQEVELFFKAAHIGEYNIHIEPNGEFEYITLVDKVNGSETNMMTNSYSFTTTPKENGNRFSLRFATGKGADGQENFVYQSGSELIINGEGHLQIIDLMGRVIYNNEVVNDNNRIDISRFNKGAYIIRMINEECVKTQKITVY